MNICKYVWYDCFMSYSCLEELQVAFDLSIDKIDVLSNAGCKYKRNNWLIVTDDGICHLFDKDGNPVDIRKVTYLKGKHIRKDIKKIVIPNSVIHIENWAFSGCSGLTNVMIGKGVKRIAIDVFAGCCSLTSVTIPDNVTSIGNWAFEECNKLTSVTIGNGVTSIGDFAFENCMGLTSMVIPDSVTSIGCWAFKDCRSLTSVIIGNGVTRIRNEAFNYCDAMTNLTFKGKTLEQVKKMDNYPWGITNKSIIQVG